jgi:hypothetical protein
LGHLVAIQIVGFSDGRTQKYTQVESVRDVFSSPAKILSQIPLPEQLNVNLKYSIFSDDTQEFLPIRITELPDEDVDMALLIVAQALNSDVGSLLSQRWGNTLEILVQLKDIISKEEYTNGYFKHKKDSYISLAQEILASFKDEDIDANIDTDVFNKDTYFPLPGHQNVKILNSTCEPLSLDLDKRQSLIHKSLNLITLPDVKKEAPSDGTPTIRCFRHVIKDKDGAQRIGGVAFDALLEEFDKCFFHVSLKKSQIAYTFNGQHWEIIERNEVNNFCERLIVPRPSSKDCMEFREKVYRTNLINHEWFEETTFKKINFQNGVLDLETMELLPHSRNFGFLYVLPYSYDPTALSPNFDHHLHDITCGDPDLQKILMEYVGYAISNDPVWEQKCLVLLGGGRNGKSTFIRAVKNLVGKNNYCALSIDGFNKEQHVADIEGKLFNISEETPHNLYHSSSF